MKTSVRLIGGLALVGAAAYFFILRDIDIREFTGGPPTAAEIEAVLRQSSRIVDTHPAGMTANDLHVTGTYCEKGIEDHDGHTHYSCNSAMQWKSDPVTAATLDMYRTGGHGPWCVDLQTRAEKMFPNRDPLAFPAIYCAH